jgi:ketosteroid isomerase-like protein
MKLFIFALLFLPLTVSGQIILDKKEKSREIIELIAQYSEARELRDTVLLGKILTDDIDQLVSNGEWRNGIQEAVLGMQQSSNTNPGTRSLAVEKIKFLSDDIALVDCRYIIINPDAAQRNLWSSFTVILKDDLWKITAIRNMSPSSN